LAGGELEQIQFLLGHVSVQATERYLGCKQRLRGAVNNHVGIEPPACKQTDRIPDDYPTLQAESAQSNLWDRKTYFFNPDCPLRSEGAAFIAAGDGRD